MTESAFLIFKCGIPMFGYKGVDNYRSARRVVGAHLYEGAAGDERDWRTLHDITPYSCVNDNDRSDILKAKALEVMTAKQHGILTRREIGTDGTLEFKINILDENSIQAEDKAIQDVIASGNIEKAKNIQLKIQSEQLPVASARTIKNIGARGSEETVVEDFIISSQHLESLIEKENAKFEKRAAAVKELDDYIKDGIVKASDEQIFAGAVCTGVIRALNDYTYVYVKENFGLTENEELTTIDSEPYGEYLPLYSAFVGFAKLDADIKADISAAIKDKKVNHHDEVAAAFEKAKEFISQDKLNQMAARAQRSFASSSKDVMRFLKDIAFEINNF